MIEIRGFPGRIPWLRVLVLTLVVGGFPGPGSEARAQEREVLVEGPDGAVLRIPVSSPRGFAAIPASELERLGWTFVRDRDVVRAHSAAGQDLLLRAGNPWIRWGDDVYQLSDPPYLQSERLHLPVQVAVDLLPRVLPEVYRSAEGGDRLRVLNRDFWRPRRLAARGEVPSRPTALPPPVEAGAPPGAGALPGGNLASDSGRSDGARGPEDSRARVVVIDPGHGGRDPGTMGRRGVREKEVALAVGRALARELRKDSTFEVYMTREDDTLVPIWKRGELATGWKGDRPGIFVSLHANAVPQSRSIRGYETYFLSDARTEHERRVAAIENAPLEGEAGGEPLHQNPDLSFILKELRNLDHQHWSGLLAEMVQEEMGPVHPGSNRGVKQGPFAVLTNALMPSVLVEIGFLTNPQEELLLGQSGFQRDAAGALAEAIRRFFRRYPPGQGASTGAGR